jgi:hypothetical protein
VAQMLMQSYPQQAHSPKTYASQLTILLMQYPFSYSKKLVHPTVGILATNSFLPTISEVKKFLDPKAEVGNVWKPFEIENDVKVPPEERKKNEKMLRACAAQIRKAAAATKRFNFKPIQDDCRERIAAGTDHIGVGQFHD